MQQRRGVEALCVRSAPAFSRQCLLLLNQSRTEVYFFLSRILAKDISSLTLSAISSVDVAALFNACEQFNITAALRLIDTASAAEVNFADNEVMPSQPVRTAYISTTFMAYFTFTTVTLYS